MFNCFIISRSFISDSDETLEFFDGCIERLDDNTPLLHETDARKGVTVVVQTENMAKGRDSRFLASIRYQYMHFSVYRRFVVKM